jgi:hypothetical protein
MEEVVVQANRTYNRAIFLAVILLLISQGK